MSSYSAPLYAFVMYLRHVHFFVINESDFATMESDTVVSVCSSIFSPLDDMYNAILVLSYQF